MNTGAQLSIILLISANLILSQRTDQKIMAFYRSSYSTVTNESIAQFLTTITYDTAITDPQFELFIDDRTIERFNVAGITTVAQLMGVGMTFRNAETTTEMWKDRYCSYLINLRVRSVVACTLVDFIHEFLQIRIPVEEPGLTVDDEEGSDYVPDIDNLSEEEL